MFLSFSSLIILSGDYKKTHTFRNYDGVSRFMNIQIVRITGKKLNMSLKQLLFVAQQH